MDSEIKVPVLIAGGGPVGMTLALNLARYGVRSLLVERNPQTTKHPKMDLTNGRSMELFRRLNLTEQLRDAGVPRDNPFDIVWLTNVAGEELCRFSYGSSREQQAVIDKENDGTHAVEAPLRVSQIVIEPVLKKAIDENPLVDVRFGVRFDQLISQDENGVTAQIVDEATGKAEIVKCAFLAGCDGGGSRVRRQIGIELDGDMAVAGAHMVHFRSDDHALFQRSGPIWHYQNGSGTIIGQNDRDTYTLQAWLIPGLDVDKKEPGALLEEWVGKKFNYEILQANPWTANLVVAHEYRKGRVLLAGDSAHQVIPTGGYGMNSGVADAAALAWVFAAILEGWGGDALLDAYEEERRATAWWHVAASGGHMQVRQQIGQWYAEAGDLSGNDADAQTRRKDLAEKIKAIGNAENESWGVELGYRYDTSPVIWHEQSPPEIDRLEYTPNTVPGARFPHVFLKDGKSVHDDLGLYFTLATLRAADTEKFRAAAEELKIPLKVLDLSGRDLKGIYQRDFILVRPDQHVAWRGDELPKDPKAILLRAAGREK